MMVGLDVPAKMLTHGRSCDHHGADLVSDLIRHPVVFLCRMRRSVVVGPARPGSSIAAGGLRFARRLRLVRHAEDY